MPSPLLFSNNELREIQKVLRYKKEVFKEVFLLPKNTELHRSLVKILQTQEIILAPIKAKEKIEAIFFVSDLMLPSGIKKSEEETVGWALSKRGCPTKETSIP